MRVNWLMYLVNMGSDQVAWASVVACACIKFLGPFALCKSVVYVTTGLLAGKAYDVVVHG